MAGRVVVEELVPIDAELAVMVARSPSGASAAWPAVETAQVDGVCREVLVPGRLAARRGGGGRRPWARRWPRSPAQSASWPWSSSRRGGRLLVNEVATRPHNSGHWTIEGAVTSQFENHLRAVLDLPLGSTAPAARAGGQRQRLRRPRRHDPARLLARGLAVEGAHVHLYGKGARPGRKLGHVTVCGDDAEVVRSRAWSAAVALGTPVPGGIDLPRGGDPVSGRGAAVVAVVMGSSSDLPVMQGAVEMLERFGVAHEVRVVSAHRTPRDMIAFGHEAAARGPAGADRRCRGRRPPARDARLGDHPAR